jgi:hypothetical protein
MQREPEAGGPKTDGVVAHAAIGVSRDDDLVKPEDTKPEEDHRQ